MTTQYLRAINPIATPQNQPIFGRTDQVANDAGGYVWAVDDWTRLDRFLILGSEKGSYYASEQKLTRDNADAVLRCIQADGLRVVERAVSLSVSGRAPKNDPALFVLALALSLGDQPTRTAVKSVLPDVARTGTHLLHFVAFAEGLRGWGRALRSTVGGWFLAHPAHRLAYQAIKYQERDGWRLRDLLRLSHPKATDADVAAVLHWIVKGWPDVGIAPHENRALQQIWATERLKIVTSLDEACALIRAYRLPREVVPTELLKTPEAWAALLEEMPLHALVRNLATMTKVRLLAPLSHAVDTVTARLADAEQIRAARLHPIALLSALKVYAQGHGERSNATWTPVPKIVDALNAAFYVAFSSAEPTNQRLIVALDVSGSMRTQAVVGLPGFTAATASGALALVLAQTEPNHALIAFSDPSQALVQIQMTPQTRLDDALTAFASLPSGGTDISLPFAWAVQQKIEVDAFVLLTDNQTWAGVREHPIQALWRYRKAHNPRAKLVTIAMSANAFTVAAPDDGGALEIAGLDASTPALVRDFLVA